MTARFALLVWAQKFYFAKLWLFVTVLLRCRFLMGNNKKHRSLNLAKNSFYRSIKHGFRFFAVHSAGILNVGADALSRLTDSLTYHERFFETLDGSFLGDVTHPLSLCSYSHGRTKVQAAQPKMTSFSAIEPSSRRSQWRKFKSYMIKSV